MPDHGYLRFLEVFVECPLVLCSTAGSKRHLPLSWGPGEGCERSLAYRRLMNFLSIQMLSLDGRDDPPGSAADIIVSDKLRDSRCQTYKEYFPSYLRNSFDCLPSFRYNLFTMGKKVTYERWINLYLPDGWHEREEMGFVLWKRITGQA